MTENKYRILHSRVIEECIYIEDILRRYYGLVVGEGDIDAIIKHLNETDDNSMGVLISYYKNNKLDFLFPNGFFQKLDNVREIRNYYAHKVFYRHTPINRGNAKSGDANKIETDYRFICEAHDEFCEIYDKKVVELNLVGGKNG